MTPLPTPTVRELEILKVLWELGPSSVRAVHEQLSRGEKIAYNTVQTLIRLMEMKHLVRHHEDGRIHSRPATAGTSAARFWSVFDGAAAELVQSLLRTEKIPPPSSKCSRKR